MPVICCFYADIAYCSVIGRQLGVVIYSLCLVPPPLVKPLLMDLYALLHTLDSTNRAVAVVAHITDQEDLLDG